ncbi:MAG: hypothetical protein V4530_06240 [Pseudomonadota bacterium]
MTTTIARPRPASEEPNPRIGIGANRPPIEEQGVADFNDAIDGHAGLRKRIADLLDSAGRAAATDNETAGRCAELIRQMTAVEKVVDGEREGVKRPYLEAGRNIDGAAKALVAQLGQEKSRVRGIAEGYMREQQRIADEQRREREAQERREREEADRLAQEERDRAAAENREPDRQIVEAPAFIAPTREAAPEPVQVRSDFGAVASARKVKVAKIVDPVKAFRALKHIPAVMEALQKAAQAQVRAGNLNINGVEIVEEVGLSVR